MTAAEAAALIKNGEHIAMSGFTPAGVAKATTLLQDSRQMATWLMRKLSSIVPLTPPTLISVSM